MQINDQLIDQILADNPTTEEIIGEHGIVKELTKRLLERSLSAELTHHLGYEKNAADGRNTGNSRNGHSKKKIIGDFGEIELNVPRDRNATFEPRIIGKRQNRLEGFDHKVISLYARGLSTREIQGHLLEIYGVEVSPAFISNVTASVLDDVRAWQNRQLEEVYPVIYFDALRVNIRDTGQIIKKSVYTCLGIKPDGQKEILGFWFQENEGAKFWLSILTELKNRGVKDICIACIDGLKGFPEAIDAAFPETKVQLCIVHMIRNAMSYVSYRDYKAIAADLKKIYTASNEEVAKANLDAFAATWDARYPMISQSWSRHWENLITFLEYPPEIRKILYTTNPIESYNRVLRKVSKTRAVFPHDESVMKLFYLATQSLTKKWQRPVANWKSALNHFCIQFPGRIPTF